PQALSRAPRILRVDPRVARSRRRAEPVVHAAGGPSANGVCCGPHPAHATRTKEPYRTECVALFHARHYYRPRLAVRISCRSSILCTRPQRIVETARGSVTE